MAARSLSELGAAESATAQKSGSAVPLSGLMGLQRAAGNQAFSSLLGLRARSSPLPPPPTSPPVISGAREGRSVRSGASGGHAQPKAVAVAALPSGGESAAASAQIAARDDPDIGALLQPGGGGGSITSFGAAAAAAGSQAAAEGNRAHAAAAAALGTARAPAGPAAGPQASVPKITTPGIAVPSGRPAPPTGDDSLATSQTTHTVTQHGKETKSAITSAANQVAAGAQGLTLPAATPSRSVGIVPAPAAPTASKQAPRVDPGQFPQLPENVAKVLGNGFGGMLAKRQQESTAELAGAQAHHAVLTASARSVHVAGAAALEEHGAGEARRVSDAAAKDASNQKAALRTEAGQIGTASGRELEQHRAQTAAAVEQQAGSANSEARAVVSEGQKQALEASKEGGSPVQRSLWGRIKSAASSVVHSARAGLSALAGAARSLLDAALKRAKGIIDGARRAVEQRIATFVDAAKAVASRARAALANAVSRVTAAIKAVAAHARAMLDRVVSAVRAAAGRLLRTMWNALRSAGAWLADKARSVVNALVAAGKAVFAMAGKVAELLKLASSKVVHAIKQMVDDPRAFFAPYADKVAGMIAQVPAKAKGMYDQHVAPLMGGAGPVRQAPAGVAVQRQPEEGATGPTHGDIVWEYVGQRLGYLGQHWGSVIGNALLEIAMPPIALYRHVPPLLGAVYHALKQLFAGNFSDAVDEGLKAARELTSLLGVFVADFAIAAFIAGSIFGTPIVGEAAMFAIGMAALGVDVVVQGASIMKAWSNLSRPGRTDEQFDGDYSTIADSIVGLGITAALILVAVLGQVFGKMLLARFPKLAAGLDAIKLRLRRAAGKASPPLRPGVDAPVGVPRAPAATEFPGRAGLSPLEQSAFDRFVAKARTDGKFSPEFEQRLKGMDADGLRKIAKKGIPEEQALQDAEAKAERARRTNASDPLDPEMVNFKEEGGNVRSRWNERAPNSETEVPHGKQIAARTGEHVELFGDDLRGIDGTIGRPPRPLQLKNLQNLAPVEQPKNAYRVAVNAHDAAQKFGFKGVQVEINAPGAKVADVQAAFASPAQRGTFLSSAVKKVVIQCADGVFEPKAPRDLFIPGPADLDKQGKNTEKQPAGAGAGRPGG